MNQSNESQEQPVLVDKLMEFKQSPLALQIFSNMIQTVLSGVVERSKGDPRNVSIHVAQMAAYLYDVVLHLETDCMGKTAPAEAVLGNADCLMRTQYKAVKMYAEMGLLSEFELIQLIAAHPDCNVIVHGSKEEVLSSMNAADSAEGQTKH